MTNAVAVAAQVIADGPLGIQNDALWWREGHMGFLLVDPSGSVEVIDGMMTEDQLG